MPAEGDAPARDWLPLLQKIQSAGNLIQMTITPEDFKPLIDNLQPQGVMLACSCENTEQAKQMLEYTERKFGVYI